MSLWLTFVKKPNFSYLEIQFGLENVIPSYFISIFNYLGPVKFIVRASRVSIIISSFEASFK